ICGHKPGNVKDRLPRCQTIVPAPSPGAGREIRPPRPRRGRLRPRPPDSRLLDPDPPAAGRRHRGPRPGLAVAPPARRRAPAHAFPAAGCRRRPRGAPARRQGRDRGHRRQQRQPRARSHAGDAAPAAVAAAARRRGVAGAAALGPRLDPCRAPAHRPAAVRSRTGPRVPALMRLVLASTSAYRRELLARLRLPFDTRRPEVDETPCSGETPMALVARLALAKAAAVAGYESGAWVIGSDQVAELDGAPLGKPGHRERAIAQLSAMSGRAVAFRTAVAVVGPDGHPLTALDTTTVR